MGSLSRVPVLLQWLVWTLGKVLMLVKRTVHILSMENHTCVIAPEKKKTDYRMSRLHNMQLLLLDSVTIINFLCSFYPFYSSCLQQQGVKVGDLIVSVNSTDVRYSLHDKVVSLVKESGDELELEVVTPETAENRS